jgi:hypothetical protein
MNRTGNKELLARYQQFFAHGICLPLSENVFDKAAQLRALFRFEQLNFARPINYIVTFQRY